MEQVFDLVKKSFELYKQKFDSLIILALLNVASFFVLVPFAFMLAIFWVLAKQHWSLSLILFGVLLGLIALLIVIILGIWFFTATLVVIKNQAKTKVKEALKTAWPLAGPLMWVYFLQGLAVLGGLILLVIPGIIFSVWFCFSIYIFMSEGLTGTAAMKRSRELVRGNWWPIFSRILVLMLAGLIIIQLQFLGVLISMFFFTPFSIIYMYSMYADLQLNKEENQ